MQRNSLIKNFFKGFIVGTGKIIPGVSGAMLAVTLGIYDTSVYYINNFFKNKKSSIKYLLQIVLGILISIILFSNIIEFFLNKYYSITILFFTGLIEGSIVSLIKDINKKDYKISALTFLIFTIISITQINNIYTNQNNIIDIIVYFISGVLEAIGTVVPGISSSAILMIIGTYNKIISVLGNILEINNFISNIKVLLPFMLGLSIGLISLVRIIEKIIKKERSKLYSFILGVLTSNIVLLFIKSTKNINNIKTLLVGVVFLILGIIISNILETK